MAVLAVVPARSGSKGLKNKNIKLLNGKPLLAYSVEAALEAEIFDCVHVSTDSEEYAEISRKFGADVPFLRSEEMSSDKADSWETVLEVLDNYRKLGREFETIVLLQPTSPLRTAVNIREAYSLFCEKKANSVVSVCEMDHSPLWSNVIPEDGSLEKFFRQEDSLPRQELPVYYRINGAIYIVDCNFLMKGIDIYREKSYAYFMDRRKSVDIDTEFDFEMAEFVMSKKSLLLNGDANVI